MANNVNIGTGRAVYAAIAHVPNNEFRFKNIGMLAALRSPSLKRLIDATNPFIASKEEGQKRLVAYKENTYNPRVMLNYKPASSQGYRTSRTAAGGTSGSNGVAGIQAAASAEILYNKTLEFEIIETLFTSAVFKEPAAVAYLKAIADPKVRAQAMASPTYERIRTELGVAGYEILSRMDEDLVTPADDDLITTMVAGVGKNAAFPDSGQVGDGTADAPQPEVAAFNTDGTPAADFWNAIWDTARANKFIGKPIVVGGTKMARYFQQKSIVGPADSGYKLDALLDMNIEWYFDDRIDTVFGQNKILMFDSGAACMQTWLDHSDYGLVKVGKHENMFFGNMTVDIVQYKGQDLAESNAKPTLSLDLDFRVKQGLDSNDFPTDRIVPSMRYGVYKRPVGFFTSNTSNILNKVTGIFAFELTTKS